MKKKIRKKKTRVASLTFGDCKIKIKRVVKYSNRLMVDRQQLINRIVDKHTYILVILDGTRSSSWGDSDVFSFQYWLDHCNRTKTSSECTHSTCLDESQRGETLPHRRHRNITPWLTLQFKQIKYKRRRATKRYRCDVTTMKLQLSHSRVQGIDREYCSTF